MRRWFAILSLWLAAAAPAPEPPALTVQTTGPAVTVTSHTRDACDAGDVPDTPARAIRLASGEVLLFDPNHTDRLLRGKDLLSVRLDCHVVFKGNKNDDPAAFDDYAWLVSPYTLDGRRIFSVVHNEFHGHERPWLCPSRRYIDCWYNALTVAISSDGGRSFVRPRNALLAEIPYRYDQATGQHRGYFNPTNILADRGFFYMMTNTTAAFAQRPGNCLLRTDRLEDVAAWRAWDGHGFGVRFVDPYTSHDDPAAHVCAPVGAGRLRWPVTSLVRHAPSGLFIAMMMDSRPGGGIYVATSRDLIGWSAPARVVAATGEAGWQCGDPSPLAYPSLLDPASPSRNFETVGDTAVLFLTRFNPAGCKLDMDRDLIRLPVAISAAAEAPTH